MHRANECFSLQLLQVVGLTWNSLHIGNVFNNILDNGGLSHSQNSAAVTLVVKYISKKDSALVWRIKKLATKIW